MLTSLWYVESTESEYRCVYVYRSSNGNITANEKSSTKKPFKKVYEREEEEEYVEPLTSTGEVK